MTDTTEDNPVSTLVQRLKDDHDLRFGWYCNLKMATYDALLRRNPDTPHIDAMLIGHDAARTFLSYLSGGDKAVWDVDNIPGCCKNGTSMCTGRDNSNGSTKQVPTTEV